MDKKVLVTGGAGFIASHVVDLLLENDYEVVVVDNLVTGNRENINEKSRFYKIDICSPALKKVFEENEFDYVVHHAAQINVRNSVKNPVFDAQTNVIGSINLLECCREFKVKKIIYSSSGGAVYGNPIYLPCDEKHPLNPISPYAVSKLATEYYLFQYKDNFGMDYVALRYSNVYGPRQDPKGEAGVISIFSQNLTEGRQCKINGDGNQTRDFVYVSDVARANLLALQKNPRSRVINIGSGKETSVNELFMQIRALFDENASAVHGPEMPGEVRRVYLKVSLAEKEIGWKPTVELKEGIKKTVEWFKSKN